MEKLYEEVIITVNLFEEQDVVTFSGGTEETDGEWTPFV